MGRRASFGECSSLLAAGEMSRVCTLEVSERLSLRKYHLSKKGLGKKGQLQFPGK